VNAARASRAPVRPRSVDLEDAELDTARGLMTLVAGRAVYQQNPAAAADVRAPIHEPLTRQQATRMFLTSTPAPGNRTDTQVHVDSGQADGRSQADHPPAERLV